MNLEESKTVLAALRRGMDTAAASTETLALVDEALTLMTREVARLDAARASKNPAHWVIRYQDGAYNLNQGFTATLDEATLYSDQAALDEVLASICDVEQVLTFAAALELEAQ